MRELIATTVFMTCFVAMMSPILLVGLHLADPTFLPLEWWHPLIGMGGLLGLFLSAVTGVYGERV